MACMTGSASGLYDWEWPWPVLLYDWEWPVCMGVVYIDMVAWAGHPHPYNYGHAAQATPSYK